MEPVQYLRALRRRWFVVIAAVVVAALSALAVSRGPTPIAPSAAYASFAATTTIYDTGLASGTSVTVFPLATLPTIIAFPDVAHAAAAHTNGKVDPDALASQVSTFADAESGFLDITGIGGTPRQAELV